MGSGVGDLGFPSQGEKLKMLEEGVRPFILDPRLSLRDRTAGVEVISREDSLACARI